MLLEAMKSAAGAFMDMERRSQRLSFLRLESMKRLSTAFFMKTEQGLTKTSCRQQALEGLVPPTPLTTRTNATGLVVRGAPQVEHLLDLLGLEVIAQALPGSEATRTPEGFHCFNLKNTPIVNILVSVCR